jgi:hypothetical protein
MCKVIESVTRVAFITLGHSRFNVCNYIIVPGVRILYQKQFLGRVGIPTVNEPIRIQSMKHDFIARKILLKLFKLIKTSAIS